MTFSSLHNHTVFCDGSDDIETMCRAAYENGLCSIGFSSHAPILKKTGIKTFWHMSEDRLNEYMDSVLEARKRWQGKLAVYLGLELDYIKGLCCAKDKDIVSYDLDFIIGSVHYLVPDKGARPFTVDGSMEELEQGIAEGFDGDGEAAMHAYWDTVAEMTAVGGFEILGHADLLMKNNAGNCWFNPESAGYKVRLAEIAAAISRNGCTAEINTGGLNRGSYKATYPSGYFLQQLCKYNVPMLISADAHKAQNIKGHYNFAVQALLEAGYSEHVLFEGKNNELPLWRVEKF